MDTHRLNHLRPSRLLLAAVLACTAAAAGAETAPSARADAQKQLQSCDSGNNHQDRATCRREAHAVLNELKKNPGKLDTQASLAANAKLRCEALSGSERTACMARIGGQGTVSGSVERGGVLRELVTRETVEPGTRSADTAAPTATDTPAKP